MRVTLIHNPDAGDEAHSAKRILKALEDGGYEAHLAPSKGEKLQKALEDPGELVVVAGGDGSIKKVAIAIAGRGIPMAILPIGTANNIAKSFGVLGSVRERIAGWRNAQRRRLAIGTVATRWGTMRFVESVGVGVFTELISRGTAEVSENASGLTGHEIDRALQLLQRIVEKRPPRHRHLEIDGTDRSGEYLLVEVMNVPLVGPNVPLAPDADYGDDQLDVVTVTEREREVLAKYLEGRLAGGAAPPKLTVRRGARVKIRASPGELHVDDEAWHPDPPTGAAAPGAGREEGDVTIALEEVAVEVLVENERPRGS